MTSTDLTGPGPVTLRAESVRGREAQRRPARYYRQRDLLSPVRAGPNARTLRVHLGSELVGISTRSGYTVNVGGWSSLAMVDEQYAVDGTEGIVA